MSDQALTTVSSLKFLPAEPMGANDERNTRRIVERIGRQKLTSVISKLLTVTDLLDLKEIKESRIYKGFEHIDEDGNSQSVTTWEEYCLLVEGRSVEAIDLDLKNFDALGSAFFDAARKIGIGPGKMRELRKLPPDIQEKAQAAADDGNKAALLEIIEMQAELRRKEREEAARLQQDQAAALEKAQASLEASRTFARERTEEVQTLKEELYGKKLKAPDPDAEGEELRATLSATALEIKRHIMTMMLVGSNQLMAHGEQTGVDHRLFISGLLVEIERECRILRDRHDLPTEPRVSTRPEWMKPEA
jgi:hypothetical protein